MGDIVVTRRARVGDSAPIPVDDAAIGQNLVILRSNGEQVDQAFLRWAVRSPAWWDEVDKWRNVGAVFTSLNVRDIARMAIPVPPLPIQRAIAEVLGALDDKIAANQHVVGACSGLLVGLGSTLMAHGPSIALGELVDSAKEQIQPTSMDAVAHFSLPAFDAGQWPAADTGGGIMSAKLRVRRPSVLVSRLNPRIPRVWDVPELPIDPAVASTEFMVLEPCGFPTGALWAVLSQPSVANRMQELARGTSGSHQRVRPQEALGVEVPDPRAFTDAQLSVVSGLSDRRHAALVESRHLATLRDTVLPHLMSGRITVREAEQQVEEVL